MVFFSKLFFLTSYGNIASMHESMEGLKDAAQTHLGDIKSINRAIKSNETSEICYGIEEFDELCEILTSSDLSFRLNPRSHSNIIKLREQLEGQPLPLLKDMFPLAPNRASEALDPDILETFVGIRQKIASGEMQMDASSPKKESDSLVALLIDGYGIFIENHFKKPGLADTFSLAFREALYKIKPLDDGEGLYPRYYFRLWPYVSADIVKNRDKYSSSIKEEIEKNILKQKSKAIGEELQEAYNDFEGERFEDSRKQCRGAYNFAYTIVLAADKTNDETVVDSLGNVLKVIAKWSNAGSNAWELRRVIRRADNETLVNIFSLITRIAYRYPDGINNKGNIRLIDADGLFCADDEDKERQLGFITEGLEYLLKA